MLKSTNILGKGKRIAIVHDALCVPGGAERVVLWMSKAYPDAPIFTSVYLRGQTFPEFQQKQIHTLPFSKLIRTEKQFKLLYPLWYIEQLGEKFREFDIVLSSSTYLAKFINADSKVKHKAYIYAPFRFLWKPESYSENSLPTSKGTTTLVKRLLPMLRKWDYSITNKIPSIATSCQNMVKEIEQVYQKPSTVIYPPIQIDDFPLLRTQGEYYLTVSRLISHKRVDIAIEACNQLKEKLIVVGDGSEMQRLKQISGNTIQFTGRVSDEDVKQLYANCKALIFPSHEDYGISPLEAQACGKPVIAFGKGGSLETIQEGKTGLFFFEQSADALVNVLRQFRQSDFSPEIIRSCVRKFDVPTFITDLKKFVDE